MFNSDNPSIVYKAEMPKHLYREPTIENNKFLKRKT